MVTIAEKLLARSIPEPNSGCHLWEACTNTTGYGLVRHQGKQEVAHRLAWLVHRGAIPDGLSVLHKCDVRACVNPEHLFLGTQTDNMRDMAAKGRGVYRAKLTAEDARAIRSSKSSLSVLARQYGVNDSAIQKIKAGTRWKGV